MSNVVGVFVTCKHFCYSPKWEIFSSFTPVNRLMRIVGFARWNELNSEDLEGHIYMIAPRKKTQ